MASINLDAKGGLTRNKIPSNNKSLKELQLR